MYYRDDAILGNRQRSLQAVLYTRNMYLCTMCCLHLHECVFFSCIPKLPTFPILPAIVVGTPSHQIHLASFLLALSLSLSLSFTGLFRALSSFLCFHTSYSHSTPTIFFAIMPLAFIGHLPATLLHYRSCFLVLCDFYVYRPENECCFSFAVRNFAQSWPFLIALPRIGTYNNNNNALRAAHAKSGQQRAESNNKKWRFIIIARLAVWLFGQSVDCYYLIVLLFVVFGCAAILHFYFRIYFIVI